MTNKKSGKSVSKNTLLTNTDYIIVLQTKSSKTVANSRFMCRIQPFNFKLCNNDTFDRLKSDAPPS